MVKAGVVYILIVGAILAPNFVRANTCDSKLSISSHVENYFPGASTLISAISCGPGFSKERAAIDIWKKMVGLEQYQNAQEHKEDLPGMRSYLKEVLPKNDEFRSLLFNIGNLIDSYNISTPLNITEFSVTDSPGVGYLSKVVAGSLWTDLMVMTNKDAKLALRIVGQTQLKFIDSYTSGLIRLNDSAEKNHIIATQVPGLIDSSFIVSKALVDRMAKIYPLNGRSPTPGAKIYHYTLAALMSCEMLSTGASPTFVAEMQKITALGYRFSRWRAYYFELKQKLAGGGRLTPDEEISWLAYKFIDIGSGGTTWNQMFWYITPQVTWWQKAKELVIDGSEKLGMPVQKRKQVFYRLQMWELERDWTLEQHQVGFEFARRVCKPAS